MNQDNIRKAPPPPPPSAFKKKAPAVPLPKSNWGEVDALPTLDKSLENTNKETENIIESTQSAVPAVKNSEPIEVVEPTKVAEPVIIDKTIDIAVPTKTIEPAVIDEPVKVDEAVTINESIKTVEPIIVDKPVEIFEPAKAAEPVVIAEPVDVVEPVETAEPIKVDAPKEVYTPVDTSEPVKNENVYISNFSKNLEEELFETFGEEIMSTFVTNADRIGAAYVITQSLINTYIAKNKTPAINHSLMPADLDSGIDDKVIQKIIDDIETYYIYFIHNSSSFEKNKGSFNLQDPYHIEKSVPESIARYLVNLFKTISSLDINNESNQSDEVHTPYESDMININKFNKDKMWDLAKQIQESIAERDAIIDEIALPVIKRNYPIDARKMAANFLRESKVNPEIALKALYNSPATFSPIIVERIPRKLWGILAPTQKDAIEINKSLGRFLKKFVS